MQYARSAQQFKNPFRPNYRPFQYKESVTSSKDTSQGGTEASTGEENSSFESREAEDLGEQALSRYQSSSSVSEGRSHGVDSDNKGIQ